MFEPTGLPVSVLPDAHDHRRPAVRAEISNRLADPRLEALRRFAVAAAHGTDGMASREREQLRSLDYTKQQIEQAEALAARWPSRPRSGLSAALLLPIMVAALAWLICGCVDDRLMSFVVAMTIALPFWSTLAPRSGSRRS